MVEAMKIKSIDHLGNEYESRTKMCEHYSIKLAVFCYRTKAGWSLEDALTLPIGTMHAYSDIKDEDGKSIKSISDMCRKNGIPLQTYYNRKRKGLEVDEILHPTLQFKVYDHLGQGYESKKAMCDAYHIDRGTFSTRIKQGMTLKDALTIPPGDTKKASIMDHLGNTYDSIGEMCKAYRVERCVFQDRRRKGYTLKECLEGKEKSGLGVDVKKLGYNTVREFSKSCGLSTPKLYDLYNKGIGIEGVLSYSKSCVTDHNSNEYESVSKMCEAFGILLQTFNNRIEKGWDLESALTTPVLGRGKQIDLDINAYGMHFIRASNIKKQFDLKSTVLFLNRIKNEIYYNFDTELIVSVRKLKNIHLAFIGLDGQARYKVIWSDDYQTTRQIIEHERPDLLELYDKAHPDGKWNPYRVEE